MSLQANNLGPKGLGQPATAEGRVDYEEPFNMQKILQLENTPVELTQPPQSQPGLPANDLYAAIQRSLQPQNRSQYGIV